MRSVWDLILKALLRIHGYAPGNLEMKFTLLVGTVWLASFLCKFVIKLQWRSSIYVHESYMCSVQDLLL